MSEKTKERVGITLDVFENWTGLRVDRGIGIEGTVVVDKEDANNQPIDYDVVLEKLNESVSENTEVDPNPSKRTIKVKQNCRFDVSLPVPSTDDEAKELYGVPLTDLVEAGVMKLSYDRDTDIGNEITAAIEKGEDFSTLEDVSTYAQSFETELSTPKEKRISKNKETAKKAGQLDALMSKYEVDNVADLMELIEMAK